MIVLASKSAARRTVLEGAGVPFEAVGSDVDEDAAKAVLLARGAGPKEIADSLAELKALKVSEARPEHVVGADQTLDLEGRLYDKVETMAQARDRLLDLRGRTHLLHAAVVVAHGGRVVWRDLATARLTMRNFSEAFLDDYLAREGEAVLGSVGCYRLESLGAQLFSEIEGDYFSILGLPLLGLLDLLRRQGALAA